MPMYFIFFNRNLYTHIRHLEFTVWTSFASVKKPKNDFYLFKVGIKWISFSSKKIEKTFQLRLQPMSISRI